MINQKIKIIFFGTPKFAEIILQALLKQKNFEIVAIVTAPDKLMGRKQTLTLSPVKILAKVNKLPILQPDSLNDNFVNQLKKYSTDLIVVAAYGKIIPKSILDIPKYGSLNVHPSLLPKYRGASPIQAAILNGDEKTGVTIILMDEKMDHGPTLARQKIKNLKLKTFYELHDELAAAGAGLLIKTIWDFVNGKIKSQEQDHTKASFCKIIKKEAGQIDFNKMTAEKIYNMWRAYISWPGIFSEFNINNNKKIEIKLIEIKLTDVKKETITTGEFFVKDKKLYVSCQNNQSLEVIKLQPIDRREMGAREFVNGYLKK